ncbi:restriction endonuclease subunit S [Enterobacter quasihormaechei]|uniref:restriction endonuclease subunit S n=1 Tax=Enterobacter quasihormaechei TaxID=2529382 RepID=UPI002FCFF5B1
MSFEWKKYTIADVSKKVITGKTPPGTLDKYFGGEVLFVTPTDMGDNKYIELTQRTLSDEGEAKLAKQKFECGIVVSCIGWQMGKAAIVRNTAVTNQQINTIIPNGDLIDVDFLYYTLSEKRTEIFNLGATATRTPILKKSLFERIEFHAPKLEQQKKIGNILSSLDAKIISNKEINQTLEQMAQALFKSWFVDFEPVKAKIAVLETGGSQEAATLAAMAAISGKDTDALVVFEREDPEQYTELKATAELFPSAMQDSELGAVPKGWMSASLGSILEPKKGKNITKKTIEEGDVPVVAGGLTPAYYHSKCNVTGPVITISASGANAGFVNLYHCDIWASDCSYINKTQTHFVYCFYTFLKIKQEEITHMQQGAAQPHVYPKDLMRLGIVIPTMALWKKLEEILNSIYGQIGVHLNQNMYLESLRDTLLPKLISGEITLPEAEQAVSEVENV